MIKTDQQADRSRSRGRKEWIRREFFRQLTPWLQNYRIVRPLTLVANAGPHLRATPLDVTATRLTAPACHSSVWCSVRTLRPRPDRKSNRQGKDNKRNRRERVRKEVGAATQKEGRHGRAQKGKRKGKYRSVTSSLFPKKKPAGRNDRSGATNRWIKRKGRRRGVIWQDIPQTRRTFDSRRSTGTGFMWTLEISFFVASGKIRLGRDGRVTSRLYDAPIRKVGQSFVVALVEDLRGVRDRLWNLERFIVFQMVIVQKSRHVTASQEIRRRIEKILEAKEARCHGMLVEETPRTCTQYLTATCREESK